MEDNNDNFGKTDMIAENELRVGNYVKCVEGNIIRINKDDMMCILTQTYEVKPIRITEEILLKCGFDWKEYNDYRHPVLIGTLTLYEGVAELNISDMYSVWVNSLHQLQNIHFALMGEELEVKI